MYDIIIFFRIVESKNPDYAVGDYITAMFGWRTHTIAAADKLKALRVTKINPALSQPKSTAIGVLGMPGYAVLAVRKGISLPHNQKVQFHVNK